MADTTTTAYGLTKPEIGASEDTWGTKINTDLDTLDTVVNAIGGKTAAATLSYADAAKIATTATGVDVTGNVVVSGTVDGVDIAARDAILTSTTATADAALPKAGGTMTGDLSFGDNDKAIFGAGSDLQIYHDGSHSYISDQGTGNIKILADDFILKNSADTETMIQAFTDASVSLWYDNATKLATTATGIDVTGTVTADGLTVAGGITTTVPTVTLDVVEESSNADGLIGLSAEGSGRSQIRSTHSLGSASDLRLITDVGGSAKDRLKIASNGDISFYEDTGTTAKFFWDASAEDLVLGSRSGFSAGSAALVIADSASNPTISLRGPNAGAANIYFGDTTDWTQGAISYDFSADAMRFYTSNVNERMRIDSSGNVGIGTEAPARPLHVLATTQPRFQHTSAPYGMDIGQFDATGNASINNVANAYLEFATNNTGRMRIDSSGNVLVGTTTAPAFGNVNFGTSIYVGSAVGDENSGIYMGLSGVYPSVNGALSDNTIDLGNISYRWDDVYATNGTIQTSDRNEKEAIASLTPAEMLVAARLSSSFKNFKWKDAVAEKGAAARMHSGIIAQDVQAAFTAEGLDAGDYAMFISGTWWETYTDVPAVLAVAEELDENGVVLVEAVEAADAYTRTDTYDTLEEAPVGATERTRLGVRYPELLSFVAAYSDQRFLAIETRIAALEG